MYYTYLNVNNHGLDKHDSGYVNNHGLDKAFEIGQPVLVFQTRLGAMAGKL